MKMMAGEDWIGMACGDRRVPHSTVAAECSDPLGEASDAELIHDLLTGGRSSEEDLARPRGRR
jgi:hypothetical protein